MKRQTYLDFCRALAIIFITNSHLGAVFPYSAFAIGGMFGNCIFFLISGILLSAALPLQRDVHVWFYHRLVRIYAPLVCVVALLLPFDFFEPAAGLTVFIYSEHYWFLPVLAAFYLPAYFISRYVDTHYRASLLLLFALAAYLLHFKLFLDISKWSIEQEVATKIPFYFLAMLTGVSLQHFRRSASTGSLVKQFAFALGAYVVSNKVLHNEAFLPLQFIAQLSGLWSAVVLIRLTSNLFNNPSAPVRIPAIAYFLSARTLEIYLVQVPLLSIPFIQNREFFPLNLGLFLFLLITLSELLFRFAPAGNVLRMQTRTANYLKLKKRNGSQ